MIYYVSSGTLRYKLLTRLILLVSITIDLCKNTMKKELNTIYRNEVEHEVSALLSVWTQSRGLFSRSGEVNPVEVQLTFRSKSQYILWQKSISCSNRNDMHFTLYWWLSPLKHCSTEEDVKARFHYPSWRVTGFHYPSTRAVLTGSRFH